MASALLSVYYVSDAGSEKEDRCDDLYEEYVVKSARIIIPPGDYDLQRHGIESARLAFEKCEREAWTLFAIDLVLLGAAIALGYAAHRSWKADGLEKKKPLVPFTPSDLIGYFVRMSVLFGVGLYLLTWLLASKKLPLEEIIPISVFWGVCMTWWAHSQHKKKGKKADYTRPRL